MLNEVRYRYFLMHNELGTELYFLDVDNNITYYIYLKKNCLYKLVCVKFDYSNEEFCKYI